jgi:hypothetical protein
MNRLLVVIVLLAMLLLAVTTVRTVAENPTPFQDFDRDECYDNCPCNISGFEQACGECIQKCDREFWKSFDEKSKELEKEN